MCVAGKMGCRSKATLVSAVLLPCVLAFGINKIYLSSQAATNINQCLAQFSSAQRDWSTLNENATQDTKCFFNCLAQRDGLVLNGNLSRPATVSYFDQNIRVMRQSGIVIDGTTYNALSQNCYALGTNATCDRVYQQFLCLRRAIQSSITYGGRR